MKKKIKWIIIGIVLVVISLALYNASKPNKNATMDEMPQITFEVKKEALVNKVDVKGKSLYEQETLVYAPFGSKVAQWIVEDGQQVAKGDILFRMDKSSLENEIVQTEASIRKTRLEAGIASYTSRVEESTKEAGDSEADRVKIVAARESSKLNQELSEVTASVQEKELAVKRGKLAEAEYQAPTDGIFLYDSAAKKQHAVTENQFIGKIVDINKLRFTALVGEKDVFRIKPDMAVKVKITAVKEVTLAGKVLKVSKFAKVGTDDNSMDKAAQFEVIISLEPSEYLIAGLSLTGEIETERKDDTLVVPAMAVIKENGSHFVMLSKGENVFERQQIKIGMETSEKMEVLEGLKEGDVVALP